MDCLLIIYLFFLFVLLVPKSVFTIPVKNNMLSTILHGLLFVSIFYLTYSFIRIPQRENLEVQGTNTDSLVNIIKKIVGRLNTPNDNTHYKINNEVIQVTPDVAEEYDIIYDDDLDNTVIVPPT